MPTPDEERGEFFAKLICCGGLVAFGLFILIGGISEFLENEKAERFIYLIVALTLGPACLRTAWRGLGGE